MVQEEAQDQKNDFEVLDIYPVDVISCYWKPSNGVLMLWITRLNGIGEDIIKSEYVKVDYPDAIALYFIGTSIGVKKYREKRNFRAAKYWRDWAVRFINAKKKRIY